MNPTIIHPTMKASKECHAAGGVSLETENADIELEYDRGLTWCRTHCGTDYHELCLNNSAKDLQGLRDYGYVPTMACKMSLSCQDSRYTGLWTEFVIYNRVTWPRGE